MQNYSLKRLPFPPLNWLNTLSKNQLTILVVLALFLDSILFHWSNFMSKTLITVTLLSVLKFSKNKQCKFFNYVLFWRIFWLFHTLYLSIHISESTSSFLLRKKKAKILTGIALFARIKLWKTEISTTSNPLMHEQSISPNYFGLREFLSTMFYTFLYKGVSCLPWDSFLASFLIFCFLFCMQAPHPAWSPKKGLNYDLEFHTWDEIKTQICFHNWAIQSGQPVCLRCYCKIFKIFIFLSI